MKHLRSAGFLTLTLAAVAAASACMQTYEGTAADSLPANQIQIERIDTVVLPWGEVRYDTITSSAGRSTAKWRAECSAVASADSLSRYSSLSDEDYRIVAEELGVEVAAMKAVVRIEAGASLQGFVAPGVPVVNFDRAMYNKAKPSGKAKAPASSHVPAGITNARARSEWSQLIAARKVNREKADMGTFWGMFQIGGFNYKLCGCATVQEFVDRMCHSEFEQLQLFANFITNTGMVNDLRNKNWSAFARKYNGAGYASRGYHTRMAQAYAKYKKEESSATPAADDASAEIKE